MKLIFGLILTLTLQIHAQTPPLPAPAVKAPDISGMSLKPKGEVTSEAVAQAGAHVVTSREVQISYVLDQSLAAPLKKWSESERNPWWIDSKSEAYSKALAQVLLELVVQMEAENFSVGQVNQEDLQNYRKHVLEQMKGWDRWAQLEVSALELQQILQRKMRSKNFLKFKTESSGMQVSDDEAKRYFEKNRVKFGSMPYAQFKNAIKESLAQEQLQEKLKDWFEILKRKYRVHYLGQSG